MPRRSPLCQTCGDLTLRSNTSKVLIFILFGAVLVSVYILLNVVVEDRLYVWLLTGCIFGVLLFGAFVRVYVTSIEGLANQ